MLKFAFRKLVRDKIVKQQIASGAKPKYRKLSQDEHAKKLVNKIIEEAKEINPEDGDAVKEIADVQQALDDLRKIIGISSAEVAKEQKLKNAKAGSFSQGIYVEYVEIDENDEWVKYYRKNSDRYPQI